MLGTNQKQMRRPRRDKKCVDDVLPTRTCGSRIIVFILWKRRREKEGTRRVAAATHTLIPRAGPDLPEFRRTGENCFDNI
jgi:hypothetical protein